jgi:hypothetical protein
MKKLTFLLAFFLCSICIAQTTNTLEVYGTANFTREAKEYKTTIILSMDQIYYAGTQFSNISELKTAFLSEVKAKGVDASKLVEKPFDYYSLGYQREGTVFDFVTISKDEMIKVLMIKTGGAISQSVQVKADNLTDAKYNELLGMAIADAKKNADRLASKVNKKAGDIVSISEISAPQTYWTYAMAEEMLSVKIVYQLLN